MSLLESFGAGLQSAGEVLSPQVYEKNAIERREQAANALPNMLRQIQIARAQREEVADKQFAAAVKGANPGMTSSALLDAVQAVDPSVLATSPAAQTYLQYVNQRQQREQAVERERQRLQAAQDRLNKPTEHVVNGKLIRSYVDGRTEVVDLPAPTTSGGSTRFSISPKDYTPASLQKYGKTGNVGDLVAIKSDTTAAPESADFNKTGEAFLTTLPAQDRTFVKKLANYEIDPKTLSVNRGQRERYLKLATQYNPDFDQKEYNAIYNAINRFATGAQGNTVRSMNVAIEHTDTARRLFGALNNGNIPLFNKIANEFATQTGKPAPTNLESVAEIVADEVVKGVIGGPGALADREAAAKKIRASASPAQAMGVLDSWTELLGGQLKGLERQYEGATRRKDFRQRFMTPRALEAMGSHGGGGAGGEDPLGIRGK